MDRTPNSKESAQIDAIIARATTDAEFRQRLLDDSGAAISEALDIDLSKLPNQFNLKFIEKDPGVDAVIVLPDYLGVEGELSDAELEAVAGGSGDGDGCIWTCLCSETEVSTN